MRAPRNRVEHRVAAEQLVAVLEGFRPPPMPASALATELVVSVEDGGGFLRVPAWRNRRAEGISAGR